MKNISDNEKNKLLNNYLNTHGSSYQKYEIEQIKKNFGSNYSDYLTQIYCALNLLEDDENPYIGFADLIEKLYGLDINILEVGCGVYPALGKTIAARQERINKGTITVYDPLLSTKANGKKIKLVNRKFTDKEDISSYDLIIGKEPCLATYTMIEKGREGNKELLLSPCKCYGLMPSYIDFISNPVKEWFDYVKSLIENDYNNVVNTYYLDKKMHYDNPIYSKVLKK